MRFGRQQGHLNIIMITTRTGTRQAIHTSAQDRVVMRIAAAEVLGPI